MSQFTVERVPLTEVCEFDESSPIDDRIVAESMLLALIQGEHPLRNRSYNVLATNFKKHLSGPSRCTNQRGGISEMGVNLVVYRKIPVVAGIIDTGSAGAVSHRRQAMMSQRPERPTQIRGRFAVFVVSALRAFGSLESNSGASRPRQWLCRPIRA